MATASFTTRIDKQLKSDLEEIARLEDRSASYMANLAIRALIEERKATRELLQTGLLIAEKNAPAISPNAVHDWLMADDEQPFPKAGPAS